ncbi:hypothetical protein ACEPPN_000593 [Leptodophora sp. 'Broadleaf-Isolate-01']
MNNDSKLNQQPAGSGSSQAKGNSNSDPWAPKSPYPQTGQKTGDSTQAGQNGLKSTLPSLPKVSLPKGGGAIQGIGEKFDVNPATGTGSATIPIKVTPAREEMQPQLSLRYDSGHGNGPFGLGWQLSGVGSITRKTSKGIPQYQDVSSDDAHSDVFLMSDAEDLVPRFKIDSQGNTLRDPQGNPVIDESVQDGFIVRRYTPRVEQTFMRIERWTSTAAPENVHWQVTTPENRTTIFGNSNNSRIFDPAASPEGPQRIFSWLTAERYDSHGNAVIFNYKAEDSINVPITQANEAYRLRTANRYIKSIQYGNITPNRDLSTWVVSSAFTLPTANWKFSVVFDYGESSVDFPQTSDPGSWSCRPDPFSDYHAGYEVRTYRLCQRILLFHHFSELKMQDYLVGSTDFSYNLNPTGSYLDSAQRAGYVLDGTGTSFTKTVLPPISFSYSLFPNDEELATLTVQEVDKESLENLPVGIDSSAYKWVDLDGQGLSGILSEQGEEWYFKGNTSANNVVQTGSTNTTLLRFTATEELLSRPSLSVAGPGGATFGDVSGAGVLDVIQHDSMCWGFYERLPDTNDWTSFCAFNQFPNIDASNKGVNFVDLTGDGLADVLICADQVFSWFPSLGANGYGDAPTVMQFLDASMGPVWVASDTENTVYVADMSGDGLMDIVRIRNGDVCYWPNLGYGEFGASVQMDNAPWFDSSDIFNENRVHLADIDGSGTTDIIYVGSAGVSIYLNQSGNSFADRKVVGSFSPIEDTAVVSAFDLLGNGTSCIVWSSSLPSSGQAPLQYLDLMQGQKPHLLVQVVNNLGTETRIHYTPSTKFYLDDAEAGNPWLTRLPFPVQCVDRIEITDRIAKNHFLSTYSYHHGYFDGVEREFCGFARVDRWDTEDFAAMSDTSSQNIDASWHVPPTLTRTWFHTGVFKNEESISRHMAAEYFGAPSPNDTAATNIFLQSLLPDTVVPSTPLTTDALREAYRALKGSMLRQEIYAEDGGPKAGIPYSTQESNFSIEVVQPAQDAHAHSIYSVHPRETISCHYERNIDDPRVEHSMVLQVDAFGNTLKDLHINYGRTLGKSPLSGADQTRQQTNLFIYTENDVTNLINTTTDYRAPVPFERRRFELSGLAVSSGKTRLDFGDFTSNNFALLTQLTEIPFEQENDPSKKQKRPFSQSRTIYRKDSLDGMLPMGQIEPLATPGADYQLSFTPGLLAKVFNRQLPGQALENLLPDPKSTLGGRPTQQGGGYTDLDNNGSWWKLAGYVYFHPSLSSTPSQELSEARSHFFLPRAFVDPFGNRNTVDYDSYSLQPTRLVDPVGNIFSADIDYRVLGPKTVTGPNGNRAAVVFDALGVVAGTASMGKPSENIGDSLDGFKADLSQAEIDAFFAAPRGPAALKLLGNASIRIVYDPTRYWRDTTGSNLPSYTATISRETHASDPVPADGLKIQVSISYSDGFGRVVQSKIQAAAGPVVNKGPIVSQRWIGSGWTIFNNKGNTVRQYEPFFDDTPNFKYNMLVGVTPIIMYDPLSRPIVMVYPDHTYQKTAFSPWYKTEYDGGDNVLVSNPKNDADVGHLFDQLPDHEYLPSWHDARSGGQLGTDETANAAKAAAYANTPSTTHFDPMGRTIVSTQDNGSGNTFSTSFQLDITGHKISVVDALARVVVTYDYSLGGEGIHQSSMEAGERWTLNDIASKQFLQWNGRGFRYRTVYDASRRVIEAWTQQAGASEFLFQKTIWGEEATDAILHNLLGKTFTVQDQAGAVVSSDYDFKGNLLRSSRQYASNYRDDLDWSTSVDLEAPIYPTVKSYDALNRPVTTVTPDTSTQIQNYDEGGHVNKVFVNIQGESSSVNPLDWTAILKGVEYNAKNQMTSISYGNGVSKTLTYDPLRYWLTSLLATRPSGDNPLQALIYVYDPAGNVTHIRDDAQQTIYFRNKRVDPTNDYTFDPLYRLIAASGREHLGQLTGGQLSGPTPPQPFADTPGDQPGDGNAMGTYTESYAYDGVGNILSISHAGSDPKNPGWTRNYTYAEASLLEPAAKKSNRLTSTAVGSTTSSCRYDGLAGLNGNMTSMPHLTLMDWDCRDQLRATSQQQVNSGTPETTYYRYDSSGARVRKVTESQASSAGPVAPTRMKERLYLPGLELYRKFGADGTSVTLARSDLDIKASSTKRIALIQSRTQGTDSGLARLQRYQIDNHLGSATLELDETAAIVSYEEYYPYGGSSYTAVASQTEVPPKRYRFCGRERDDESGLDYGGARYYASWLGRWISCDPAGFVDGPDLYAYARLNPVRFDDPGGTQSADTPKQTPAPTPNEKVQTSVQLDDQKTKVDAEKPDPAAAWGAGKTQASGAKPIPPAARDVEGALSFGYAHSTGLGQPGTDTGGLTNAQAMVHLPIPSLTIPSLNPDLAKLNVDAGLTFGGAATGSADGVTTQGLLASLLHLGGAFAPDAEGLRKDFTWGLYEQFGFGLQVNPDKTHTLGVTSSTTLVLGYENPNAKVLSSVLLNGVFNYNQSGSTDRGPTTLPNAATYGGFLGIGFTNNLTIELGATHTSSLGGLGSAQSATETNVTGGLVWGLNSLFTGQPTKTTGSLSVGAWFNYGFGDVSNPGGGGFNVYGGTIGVSGALRLFDNGK